MIETTFCKAPALSKLRNALNKVLASRVPNIGSHMVMNFISKSSQSMSLACLD
jgi:hypothetical protein